MMKKTPTGRRFTPRRVIDTTPDGAEIIALDPLETLGGADIEQHKQAAIATLEAAGIPAGAILAEHPGGSALRDRVINHDGHAPDSAIGIAARIAELCIRLQELPKLGARPSVIAADTGRLSRLLTLQAVYATTSAPAIKAGRKSAAARSPDWWGDIEQAAREMRAKGRSDNEIADKLHKKVGKATKTVRERIAKELGKR